MKEQHFVLFFQKLKTLQRRKKSERIIDFSICKLWIYLSQIKAVKGDLVMLNVKQVSKIYEGKVAYRALTDINLNIIS